ncbi:MAG: PstS family phosphate ABC transporter substrate-binding protein [Candidatus Competibacteraceae bacterium]
MIKQKLALAVATSFVLAGAAYAQSARDQINIVGSSTVYPFATTVAEQFGKTTKFKSPKIESTGSGGGIKLFCAGVGVQHPDITNSSRRIKKSEVESCAANGVKEVVEVQVGFDGIAIANSKQTQPFNLTIQDIFLALAKEVPEPGTSKLVMNPFKTWKDVNPELPNARIEVLGPPPTSGTRDAFVELVMEVGCDKFPAIKALKDSDAQRHKAVCQTVREDGAFIEAGENDNLIVQKLVANPNALGIFGFSFLDINTDRIQGTTVDGVAPDIDTIASGEYPISRPIFFYVKKAHVEVIPGLKEYIAEFTSDKAIGPDGYLLDKGLIPMPDAMRAQVRANAAALKPLQL